MNYEQANAVKELALGVNKVLEGLEWVEYLKKQKGGIVHHYSWTPQVGESILIKLPSGIELIQHIAGLFDDEIWVTAPYECPPPQLIIIEKKHIIPILSWETIERILKKAGYRIDIEEWMGKIRCKIYKRYKIWKEANSMRDGGESGESYSWGKDVKATAIGNSRQEAVMKAIIELGKELRK